MNQKIKDLARSRSLISVGMICTASQFQILEVNEGRLLNTWLIINSFVAAKYAAKMRYVGYHQLFVYLHACSIKYLFIKHNLGKHFEEHAGFVKHLEY